MAKSAALRTACAVLWLVAATAIFSPAQTYTTLHSFAGTDGQFPSGLVQGTDGNFYGTTTYGGSASGCNGGSGCGTVFQITPAGVLTTLQSFNGANGQTPESGLIQALSGVFYGTTSTTAYSIIPGGTLATLADVNGSLGDLVQGTDGNFYGTTSGNLLGGTVFEMTPTGTLTTLYTFSGTGENGFNPPFGPAAALVQGTDGNFYGTTEGGGNDLCGIDQPLFCGTIFKITPEGALTTLYNLCSLTGCADGFSPSGLIQGSDGNFYGTTFGGGGNISGYPFGYGTVFKITPTGTLTTLHIFDGTDGDEPKNGVIEGSDGNFYGTTGTTIFKISPAGTFTVLYGFGGTGGPSFNGLILATSGTFYGTTVNSGTNKDGTVFSFSIGIGGTTASSSSLSLSPATIAIDSTGPVVMTATVAPSSGSGTPTGVISFFNGSSQVGSANLSGGVASYSYNPSALALGTYPITASYSGDATFATSTSSAQTLTISSEPAAATPSLSPVTGTYTSVQTVTISDATGGATIYYTNDGTTPTTNSAVYSGPITVNSTETINAIAAASGYSSSAVASATYTITLIPTYKLTVNPSTLTIVAGQSGTAKFTVTPMNGFDSPVTFACSGLPSEATCTFNPASVTPDGVDPVTSTVTVSTTAASAALRGPKPSSQYPIYALLIPCFGLLLDCARRRKSMHSGLRVFSMLALLVLAAGLTSCSSGSNGGSGNTGPPVGGTPAGTSTVNVTASTSGSGAISQNTALTITITQ